MTHTIDTLATAWDELFPNHEIPRNQFALWITLNGAEITNKGITATAKKFLVMSCSMTTEHLVRYASACMRNENLRNHQKTQEAAR